VSYGFSKNPDVGLSAQEVQSILPEIVKLAPFDMARDDYNNIVSKSGDNFLTICYEKMAPFFVECIKDLKKEINELREEVAELRGSRNVN
jgi:RNA processing factor Prp31